MTGYWTLETVDEVDFASKEQIYRIIEDRVVRNEFDLNLLDKDGETLLVTKLDILFLKSKY